MRVSCVFQHLNLRRQGVRSRSIPTATVRKATTAASQSQVDHWVPAGRKIKPRSLHNCIGAVGGMDLTGFLPPALGRLPLPHSPERKA